MAAGMEEDGSGIAQRREHRMGRAYLRVDEDFVLGEAASLMADPAEWEAIPPAQRTQAFQSRLYMMLARSAVRSAANKDRHRNYPFKLFGRLTHPELAAEVSEDAKCYRRLDSWSRAFVEFHEDLTSVDATIDLVATAQLAKEEIVHIEKQNSWI